MSFPKNKEELNAWNKQELGELTKWFIVETKSGEYLDGDNLKCFYLETELKARRSKTINFNQTESKVYDNIRTDICIISEEYSERISERLFESHKYSIWMKVLYGSPIKDFYNG